jgi:hypothetical protein
VLAAIAGPLRQSRELESVRGLEIVGPPRVFTSEVEEASLCVSLATPRDCQSKVEGSVPVAPGRGESMSTRHHLQPDARGFRRTLPLGADISFPRAYPAHPLQIGSYSPVITGLPIPVVGEYRATEEFDRGLRPSSVEGLSWGLQSRASGRILAIQIELGEQSRNLQRFFTHSSPNLHSLVLVFRCHITPRRLTCRKQS